MRRKELNRRAFQEALEALGLNLDAQQLDRFESFEENLYGANEVMNLTRVPRDECWLRHFVDSLLFHALVPAGSSVLDIGSGPGFPAWPLANARPDLSVVAIDSSGKMIGFLNKNPLPNLRAVQVRAEEWDLRDAFDVVTGRAVAPLPVQLELSAPLCKLGGRLVPMRTPSEVIENAYEVLGISLEETRRVTLPGTDVERVFPVYIKRAPTPRRFPRAWAEMKRKPLTSAAS